MNTGYIWNKRLKLVFLLSKTAKSNLNLIMWKKWEFYEHLIIQAF